MNFSRPIFRRDLKLLVLLRQHSYMKREFICDDTKILSTPSYDGLVRYGDHSECLCRFDKNSK